MNFSCWLGFHERLQIAKHPPNPPGKGAKYDYLYRRTFKCKKCGHVWIESDSIEF